jgi:ribonuclease P protein component
MGRKLHTSHFLVFIESQTAQPTRLGVTVSRKVGNAVVRNRVKRRVREFFRLNYPKLIPGQAFSIIAKKSAAQLEFIEICADLQILLQLEKRPKKSLYAR